MIVKIIKYANDIKDTYSNIHDCNPKKNLKH